MEMAEITKEELMDGPFGQAVALFGEDRAQLL
jgi:hypothetical protein